MFTTFTTVFKPKYLTNYIFDLMKALDERLRYHQRYYSSVVLHFMAIHPTVAKVAGKVSRIIPLETMNVCMPWYFQPTILEIFQTEQKW